MLEKEIKDLLLKNGVSDVGFCSLKDTDDGGERDMFLEGLGKY